MFKFVQMAPGFPMMALDDEKTRGFYGALFEEFIFADRILAALGLSRHDFGRYRDAYILRGEIAVFTRNGDDRRECKRRKQATAAGLGDCFNIHCPVCIMRYRLPQHPNYLNDRDEEFDRTYATIYFSIPEADRAALMGFNIDWDFHPGSRRRWEEGMTRHQSVVEEFMKLEKMARPQG